MSPVLSNFVKPIIASFLLLFLASLQLNVFAASGPILLPLGFSQEPLDLSESSNYLCPEIPVPYTGSLLFTSKYEGSDSSRSTLNEEAYQQYLSQTAEIVAFQKLMASLSSKYLYRGTSSVRVCALKILYAWANQSALTSSESNHTGRAVRKMTLAAASSSYAKLIGPNSDLTVYELRLKKPIEAWLLRLATEAMADYTRTDLDEVNNHDYWAAWAVGITGAVLQRRDLFDWSYGKFSQAMSQVDDNGFLPNELQREQLALNYQNYAVGPLVSLALVLAVNHYRVMSIYDHALGRLVKKTVRGLSDPQIFEQATGFDQDTTDLLNSNSLAWLEPWTVLNPGTNISLDWKPLRPMMLSCLGGDLTLLYGQIKL